MNPLAQLIIAETPAIIAFIKELFVNRNPNLPVPTDAEVIAAYEAGYLASIAKDEAIKASHPE